MQLKSLVEEFILSHSFNAQSDKRYRTCMNVFILRSNITTLDQFSEKSVVKFRTECIKCVKAITWNGYVKQLRIIFNFAVEKGYVIENYFNKIQYSKVVKTQQYKPLSLEEIRYVSQGIEGYIMPWFWHTVFLTFRYTGMRTQQLVTLKIRDLDFVQEVIFYSSEGSKNRKAWTIPMHSELKDALMNFLARYERTIKRELTKEDYLFSLTSVSTSYKKTGTPNTKTDQISQYFKRLSDRIGFNVSPNRFRHTVATELCNPSEGYPDLFAVQLILGHSRLEMTRNYVRPQIHRLAAALECLSK
jgi:site-specific recombinase XerD